MEVAQRFTLLTLFTLFNTWTVLTNRAPAVLKKSVVIV